jgi:hypothetical protein
MSTTSFGKKMSIAKIAGPEVQLILSGCATHVTCVQHVSNMAYDSLYELCTVRSDTAGKERAGV